MRQTLLLSNSRQCLCIVAPRSIGHHHSRIVGRYNLPDLLVTMTRSHLVHCGVIGLERHQERRLSAHSPARVVSMHHRALTHRLPKPTVPISHSAPRTSQCVLGDCALTPLHSGQRSEYRRYPPNRYAHSVVQHVRRSHHSSTHTVCACTVLVRSNIGMLSSYTSATAATPAHLHTIASHLGSGHLGNVGHVRKTLSVVFEYVSTSGTAVRRNRNVSDRRCQFIDRGRLPVAEVPHAGLSTRTTGLRGPLALGEWSCLALARSLRCGELLAKLLDRRRQTRVPVLQPVHPSDQAVVFTGWRVFVRAHSRSIRTCPSHRNASADSANQLRCALNTWSTRSRTDYWQRPPRNARVIISPSPLGESLHWRHYMTTRHVPRTGRQIAEERVSSWSPRSGACGQTAR